MKRSNIRNNEELKNFCANVVKLRERNNLSKKEMAKILKIGTKSLTAIESGIVPMRLGTGVIFRIHHIFGIKPCDVFRHLDL